MEETTRNWLLCILLALLLGGGALGFAMHMGWIGIEIESVSTTP
ncbi:hypothetical protein [Caulobacter endophyticus]|nr:hypothetical protein [Caulobacter endophyticus]